MYTLMILAGLAYIVYQAFKPANALARKRVLPPADSAAAHVDCHSHSIARPPASESLGWPAGGVIRTHRCRGRFRLAICRHWSSWTRCPSSLTTKMINVNRNYPVCSRSRSAPAGKHIRSGCDCNRGNQSIASELERARVLLCGIFRACCDT